MPLNLTDIETLFARYGQNQYSGEPVTQLDHALQTAQLAEQAGANDELVTAALLHDLGHLLIEYGDTPTLRGLDDLHQFRVIPFLRGVFSHRVLDAVQFHVDAKRYLCATRVGYLEALSPDSQRSLALQGGIFSNYEVAHFIARAHAQDAVALRLWDDQAKQAGQITPPLQHYLDRALRCQIS